MVLDHRGEARISFNPGVKSLKKRFILDSVRPDPEAEADAFSYLLRKRGKDMHTDELRGMLFEALVQGAVKDYIEGDKEAASVKLTEAIHLTEEGSLSSWLRSCLTFVTFVEVIWQRWEASEKVDSGWQQNERAALNLGLWPTSRVYTPPSDPFSPWPDPRTLSVEEAYRTMAEVREAIVELTEGTDEYMDLYREYLSYLSDIRQRIAQEQNKGH